MKYILRSIMSLFVLLVLFAPVNHVSAFDPFRPTGSSDAVCDQTDPEGNPSSVCSADGQTNPITGENGLLNKAANIFAIVTGVAAIIVIMIGGFEYVRSGGDSAKVGKAKNSILFAAIGLVIIILARSAVTLMINKLG